MGPIWGRQDPDGPHVGTTNLAIWVRPSWDLLDNWKSSTHFLSNRFSQWLCDWFLYSLWALPGPDYLVMLQRNPAPICSWFRFNLQGGTCIHWCPVFLDWTSQKAWYILRWVKFNRLHSSNILEITCVENITQTNTWVLSWYPIFHRQICEYFVEI